MEIKNTRNTVITRLLWVSLLLIGSTGFTQPAPQIEEAWPVSLSQDGFTVEESDTILEAFAPIKLALAGNQALYTYLNMPQFFPHQVISREGKTKPLALDLKPQLNKVKVSTDLGNLSLQELLHHPKSRIQGLLVLHRGNIVLEEYPGMRATDSHLWWSVAKVLAGLIVEQFIHEGLVAPAKKITDYLPEFSESGWTDVSVRNALDMASGIDALDNPRDYADPRSGIGRLINAEGILSHPHTAPDVGHNQALKQMHSRTKPGTTYEYSSANTNMLALLIERLTNRPYRDVVQERIWSKIGAEADGLMGLSPDGKAIAHGMFSSRLRDLARFGLLFTPSGKNDDVLPPRVLNKIRDKKSNQHYANSPNTAANALRKLGASPVNALSQWDALFDDGDLFKSGFDGQALYVSPSRDIVIAFFSTSKDKSAYAFLRPIAKQFPKKNKTIIFFH